MSSTLGASLVPSAMRASSPVGGPAFITHCRRLPSRCPPKQLPASASQRAPYHSTSAPPSAQTPYAPAENAILNAALRQVPQHGFTQQALAKGAQSAGYLPSSLALLPRGVFELVMFHLISQRVGLREQLQTGDDASVPKSLDARIRHCLMTRLRGNANVVRHLTGALAIMSLARNISPSLAELGRLSDEILYLAGDTSVDTSWYLKRGAIAGVYASTETFMTQDQSTNFKDTEKFLDRRLEDVRVLGQGAADVGQFLGFAGISTINILRSWNVRI